MFVRKGAVFKACMVRMAIERVQNIRDWMEVQSQNASHARQRLDQVAIRDSSEMLDGLIQILLEQQRYEQMMTDRVAQVYHVNAPLRGVTFYSCAMAHTRICYLAL